MLLLHHDHSTETNDVIDELVQCLALKEATRDDSDGLCAKLPSAKSLSSERKHNLPL